MTFIGQLVGAGCVLAAVAAVDVAVGARRRNGVPPAARVGEPVWEQDGDPDGVRAQPDRAGSSATPW